MRAASPPPETVGQDLFCRPSASPPELLADCKALLAARPTLAGDGTAPLPSWDAARPVAEWQGVTVGGVPPRVVTLDLSRMELTGSIPPQLGGLKRLHRLDLHGNRLTGPIPPQLGGLGRLRWLDLNDNRLTGSVPPELGTLPLLVRLRAENNRLHGDLGDLFEALAGVAGLKSVWLYGNDVTSSKLARFRVGKPYASASLPHPFRWRRDFSSSGTGPFGALRAAVGERVPTSRSIPRASTSAHSLFLQVGVQRGAIGIAVLAALFATLLLGLAGSREEAVEPARRLALAALVTAIVHSAFEVFLLQDNVVVSTVAWLLLGLGAGMARAGGRRSPSSPRKRGESGNRRVPAGTRDFDRRRSWRQRARTTRRACR